MRLEISISDSFMNFSNTRKYIFNFYSNKCYTKDYLKKKRQFLVVNNCFETAAVEKKKHMTLWQVEQGERDRPWWRSDDK